MNRREFTVLGGLAALTAFLPLQGARAANAPFQTFAPGLTETLLAEGRTVLLAFSATWCSTCAVQERVMGSLRAGDPGYDDAITFVRVDWDDYGNSDVARDLNVQGRSTLIVLSPEGEVGRVIAATAEEDIRALLDAGVAAAQS